MDQARVEPSVEEEGRKDVDAAAGQGEDGSDDDRHKIAGRKRSIITFGLLLAVLVTAAGVQGFTTGRTLPEQAATDHLTLRKVWVDGDYRKHLVEHAAALGIDLESSRAFPDQAIHPDPETLGGGADPWLAHAAPAPGARLRNPPALLRSHDPSRHDRPGSPPPHRRDHHLLV